MKVVMLQDVGGVGQRGTVVDVSDGYALNFLIPNGKAVQATPEKEAEARRRIASDNEAKEKEAAALRAAVHAMSGARIELRAKASEKGGLFKSIGAHDIARAILDKKGARIPETAVVMERAIKETGEHPVIIRAAGEEARIVLAIIAA